MAFADLKNDAYRRIFDEIQQAREYGEAQLARGKAEGLVEGLGKALLAVLRGRGLEVTPQAEAQILGCHDDAVLNQWLARAGSVTTVEQRWG